MDSLEKLFDHRVTPCIYLFDLPVHQKELSSLCNMHKFYFFYIDGENITDGNKFIDELAAVMSFPQFGHGWNGFEDFLTDLNWLDECRGYIMLYEKPEIFAKYELAQFKIAIDILRRAIYMWQKTDNPMYVFLKGSEDMLSRHHFTKLSSVI